MNVTDDTSIAVDASEFSARLTVMRMLFPESSALLQATIAKAQRAFS